MIEIVTTRNTVWQNVIIRIGERFSAPDLIATALIRRGCAREVLKEESPDAEVKTPRKIKDRG